MRLEPADDDDDSNENSPMLNSQDRLSGVHGTLNIGEPVDEKPNPSMIGWIRSKFTIVYWLLALVVLIALAVLVVAIYLVIHMKKVDQRFENVGLPASGSGSEKFMRLYEEVSKYRSYPSGNVSQSNLDKLASKITPEQIEQARALGLLPPYKPPPPGAIHPINSDPSSSGSMPAGVITNPLPIQTQIDGQPGFSPSTSPKEALLKFSKDGSFYRHSWNDAKCQIQCNKADITIPPLLVISLDGFAREYLDRDLVPSLTSLAECGATAEFMYPSYPSKTFPNHYTIATGLYPEAHGIVDNEVYDPTISPNLEDIKRTKYSKFFGARIDMIMDWLLLPADQRPSLVMAYFDQPDYVGHFHTSDSQVNLELSYVEAVLNYLFTSLRKNSLLDCTNVIILSDHGMQPLNKRVYVDEILDSKGLIVANGVVGRIYTANSTKSTDWLVDKLQCSAKEYYWVYDRKHMPVRYHFTETPRVGDVILDGKPGTIVFPSIVDDYHVTSDHGYDFLEESMHAIFFARGPNIRPKTVLPPFQNIELLNLFTELLRLNPDVKNNGTLGLLNKLVYNMNLNPLAPSVFIHPVQECPPSVLQQKREVKSCVDMTACQNKASAINKFLDSSGCSIQTPPIGAIYTDMNNLCIINLCSVSILATSIISYGSPVMAYETLTMNDRRTVRELFEDTSSEKCSFIDARFDPNCNNWTATINEEHEKNLQFMNILANSNNDLHNLNRLEFLLYKNFIHGPFTYLQNLTNSYIKKYSRLISITGTIYDLDMNGRADDRATFWSHQSNSTHRELVPTHIFRILIRCEDGLWHLSGQHCKMPNSTRVLAFVLPNQPKELNCLEPSEYLLANTARIRDIELLTNTYFFQERQWFPEEESLWWRTNITRSLWDY
uniref:Uncharacterized protein n=1 Tax=Acrobeloides nanus TaxID=290746 RepID=A0A914EIC5_9BILA